MSEPHPLGMLLILSLPGELVNCLSQVPSLVIILCIVVCVDVVCVGVARCKALDTLAIVECLRERLSSDEDPVVLVSKPSNLWSYNVP